MDRNQPASSSFPLLHHLKLSLLRQRLVKFKSGKMAAAAAVGAAALPPASTSSSKRSFSLELLSAERKSMNQQQVGCACPRVLKPGAPATGGSGQLNTAETTACRGRCPQRLLSVYTANTGDLLERGRDPVDGGESTNSWAASGPSAAPALLPVLFALFCETVSLSVLPPGNFHRR